MGRAHAPIVVAAVGLLAGCSLHGGRFTAVEENDVFNVGQGLDTDRDYTQGARGAFTMTDEDTPGWARAAGEAIPFFGDEGAPIHLALLIGQEIWTPEDLATPLLVPDDRPYAAWLHGGLALQSPILDPDPNRRRDRVDRVQLDLGVVGPAARGELAQNFFHELFVIPEANGWDNQIPNEFGFLATWETRWRLGAGSLGGRWGWDLLPRVRARAGNVRVDASGGVLARAGVNLGRDFGPMEVDATGLVRGAAPPPAWFAVHLGVEGNGIFHDITLDGSSGADSHSVDRIPWNFGSVAGVAAGAGPLTLLFEQHFVSPRFKERRRFHGYATLSLSWAWYF